MISADVKHFVSPEDLKIESEYQKVIDSESTPESTRMITRTLLERYREDMYKKAEKLRKEKEKETKRLEKEKQKRDEIKKAKTDNERLILESASKWVRFYLQSDGTYTIFARKKISTKEFAYVSTNKDLRSANNAQSINNIVCAIPEGEEMMKQCLLSFTPTSNRETPEVNFWKEVLSYYSLHPRLIKLIGTLKTFSNDTDEECICCFPLTNNKTGDYPAIQQFLDRLDYPDHFMAWVGSVFLDTAENSQVLWLQGEGNDGKSVIISQITNYLKDNEPSNPISQTVNENAIYSPFVYAGLSNCRLILFSDVKNLSLFNTDFVHKVTGKDYVAAEKKFEQRIQEKIFCKVAITSNYPPYLEKEPNQLRRLLRIVVSPRGTLFKDLEWEQDVEREMPAFINACLDKYNQVSVGHIILPDNDNYLSNISSPFEDVFESLIGSKLFIEPNTYAHTLDVSKLLVRELKTFNLPDSRFATDRFDRYIHRKYGVAKQTFKRNKDRKQVTVYVGMRLQLSLDMTDWMDAPVPAPTTTTEDWLDLL